MANVISNLGAVPTITVAGSSGGQSVTLTDLSNLIVANGQTASGGLRYSTFRKPGSSSSYAVTAAKTLTVRAVYVMSLSAVGTQYIFGYCDNDLGVGTSTAPVNPVYVMGNSTSVFLSHSATVGIEAVTALQFQVPAGKYPFIDNAGASSGSIVKMYGYEA